MKLFEFWLEFYCSVSLGINWQYTSIVLVPDRRKAIVWTNIGLVYWDIYASLGLNVLKRTSLWCSTYHQLNPCCADVLFNKTYLHDSSSRTQVLEIPLGERQENHIAYTQYYGY